MDARMFEVAAWCQVEIEEELFDIAVLEASLVD